MSDSTMASAGNGSARGPLELFAGRHFRLIVALVAIGCALIVLRATRGGGFRHADVHLIGISQDYGLSVTSLLGKSQYLDHIVPGAKGLSWLIGLGGPQWWLAQTFAASAIALLVVLMAVLVRTLSGSSVVGLLSGAIVGSSTVVVTISLSWTATTTHLAMLCLAVTTIILALRWASSRSAMTLTLTLAAQVGACSFFDRAQLLPVLIWIVLVVATPSDERLTFSAAWARTKATAPLLIGLFLIAFAQLALTLLFAGHNTEGLSYAASASLSDWGQAISHWWGVGVGSTVWNQFPAVSTNGPPQIAGLVVLAAIALLTIRSRRAVAIWAAAAALVTLSAIQIVAGRLGTLGAAEIASAPRYQELTILTLATLAPAAWAASGRPTPRSGVMRSALAVAVVVAGAGWLLNLREGVRAQQPLVLRSADYAYNFRNSLTQWERTGRRSTLLDGRVPPVVVLRVPQTEDYDSYSKIARIFAPGVAIPPPNRLTGVPLGVSLSGVVAPARVGPSLRLGGRAQRCGSSTRSADWLKPGGFIVGGKVPASISNSGNALVLRAVFGDTNRLGRIGVTSSADAWPLARMNLSDYHAGLRILVPAGSELLTVQFWRGAGGCVRSLEVAELLSP